MLDGKNLKKKPFGINDHISGKVFTLCVVIPFSSLDMVDDGTCLLLCVKLGLQFGL